MFQQWSASALLLFLLVGCAEIESTNAPVGQPTAGPRTEAAIKDFCGDCHQLPRPSSFAKSRWEHEVKQGMSLYDRSGRIDLIKPDLEATLAYYRSRAPESLSFDPIDSTPDERFEPVSVPMDQPQLPVAVSDIHTQVDESGIRLTVADIWTGGLFQVDSRNGELTSRRIGEVAHPSRIKPTDLDQDGVEDYLVADLGTFNPEFRDQAGVWWLRPNKQGQFDRVAIRTSLSRVADVATIDHDADGDLDLLVSDFGMHFVGSIYLGTNVGFDDSGPQFAWTVVDPRAGAIETIVHDFDDDGNSDFLALVSQHYETVSVFLHRGDGKFERKDIYQAPDPSVGSSNIEIVDMDQDGDMDVLYTNGDTFDDGLAKPYHAIHWLENEGELVFRHHQITSMPGVYRAVAGDIDGDGDVDVAAVSLLSDEEIADHPDGTFEGIIWLEQIDKGVFRRHAILTDVCQAATCALVDWDGDGDLDLVVPPHSFARESSDEMTLYRNRSE